MGTRKKSTKDPNGGLTAAGRAEFARKEGAHLKPGVRGEADTPEKKRRKGSFLRRMFGHEGGPLADEKGKPTRRALSAHAWGEPVPKTKTAARKLAKKGSKLLEQYKEQKESMATKKTSAKKSGAKKTGAKKTAAKTTSTRKSAVKKTAKTGVKRPATKRAAAKKASTARTARKASPSKTVARKTGAKKSAAKKTGAKKTGAKKNSLVANINKRKAKGTSRPRSRSTVSRDSYRDMQAGWPESKKKS